jgi:hypothetical protein
MAYRKQYDHNQETKNCRCGRNVTIYFKKLDHGGVDRYIWCGENVFS